MKLTYNSPFVLTFSFLATIIMFLSDFSSGQTTMMYFTVYPNMSLVDPLTYIRLFTHIMGHGNWAHLLSNFTFILLLGPILEEKYGSKQMFIMALITAFITGVLNNFFFSTGLLGASGIVFMMILLSSFANVKTGTIPLTFLLILVLFLGQEIINAFEQNRISEFAHIVGGICGSIFGFSHGKN